MPALPSSKVDVMYAANAAKYAQHPQLQAELLATGGAEIVGGPSTSWTCAGEDHRWSDWNGAIQARCLERKVPYYICSLIQPSYKPPYK